MTPELRISDADRHDAVERLRLHASAGRLDPEELEERVEAVLRARTAGELAPPLADLPVVAPERERPVPARRRELHAYLAVMAVLVAVWALTGAGYFWPVWPALGWGLGLLAPPARHAGCGRRARTGRAASA